MNSNGYYMPTEAQSINTEYDHHFSVIGTFEKISKYAEDNEVIVPTRKTTASAGYDFYCAEDTVIPPLSDIMDSFIGQIPSEMKGQKNYTLDDMALLTKKLGKKVTLVPTGIKCKIPTNCYLQLSARSSLPLKHWLIVANSVGIIDADYYNNPDNEGHIYFQLINLSPVPILIKKGDCFGQGIILPYFVTSNDETTEKRVGGFGSTSN